MNQEPLFHLVDGSPVYRGEVLHVAPGYLHRAGATCKAEFPAKGDQVCVRSIPTGAVPTIPLAALSREPHPDTTDRAALAKILGQPARNITGRDLDVFRAGQLHARQMAQSTNG